MEFLKEDAMWKLKAGQPDIDIVDGPLAGRSFKRGVEYTEIPPAEEIRFEKVDEVVEAVADQDEENTGGEVE
jgi:hypothetical protein